MDKYRVLIEARKLGATGAFYPVAVEVEAANADQAKEAAWKKLEEAGTHEKNHVISAEFIDRPMKWKEVTEERYWEMLGMLPPATQTLLGFLVGEPRTHRTCSIERLERPAFAAFAHISDKYYEALDAMTIAEFKRLRVAEVVDNLSE